MDKMTKTGNFFLVIFTYTVADAFLCLFFLRNPNTERCCFFGNGLDCEKSSFYKAHFHKACLSVRKRDGI